MYGGTDWGVWLLLHYLLEDLCFIDQQEDRLRNELDSLWNRDLCRSTGMIGAIKDRIAGADFGNEVASIFAPLAFRLGYIDLDRHLDDGEWRRLTKGLRSRVTARDWSPQEISELFGRPSLEIGTIFAYAPGIADASWVYFDFVRPTEMASYNELILRTARLPARAFYRELAFTPFGRLYKRSARQQP